MKKFSEWINEATAPAPETSYSPMLAQSEIKNVAQSKAAATEMGRDVTQKGAGQFMMMLQQVMQLAGNPETKQWFNYIVRQLPKRLSKAQQGMSTRSQPPTPDEEAAEEQSGQVGQHQVSGQVAAPTARPVQQSPQFQRLNRARMTQTAGAAFKDGRI